MTPPFAAGFDALSDWRAAVVRRLDAWTRFLAEHELADASAAAQLGGLREQLATDKLVLAFVAEFSRGKSELINAIFFADTGRRVLPATPGRTTMCPVELGHSPAEPPALRLLPVETRLGTASLAELRLAEDAWTVVPLDTADPAQLALALREVTRTRPATREQARELGFWDDARPDDNPPLDAEGHTELPAWRHALINYPHPLLRSGLVVLDTPGLNAVGAEPELTLGLLPSAHATVFVLGADTGVTRSDLGLWRDHLGSPGTARFVVLNKIDALADPLAAAGEVEQQIAAQRHATAVSLGVPFDRVYPVSARQALAGRIAGDAALVAQSRLTQLEAALAAQLLPQRRDVLQAVVEEATADAQARLSRHLADQRRQLAEQMLELRGLRGKSGAKLRSLLQRVDTETTEFETCTARLQALRAVHARLLREALAGLSSDRVRDEVAVTQTAMTGLLLNVGARRAFAHLCDRLRRIVHSTQAQADEMREMLAASYQRLNAEFGFSLAVEPAPRMTSFIAQLEPIERDYLRYLGLTQSIRLSNPRFMEQFRRMLVTKLRSVFERASSDLDRWSRDAWSQLEAQLRERRRAFQRRRQALERIQGAAGDLEMRLAEMEAQDERLLGFIARQHALAEAVREQARAGAAAASDGASGWAPGSPAGVDAPTALPAEADARQRVRA